MGRIRSIKPDFGALETLSTLKAETHLLAALLHPYADDEGYFNANPKLVQSLCVPLREDSLSIHEQLNQLEKIGYIERKKCAGGKWLGRVVTFKEDQRVNRPTASKLKVLWDGDESSVKTHEQLTEDSPQEGKGREWIGREGNGGEEAPQNPEQDQPTNPPKVRRAIAEDVDVSHLDPAECARKMFEHLAITAPARTLTLAGDAIRMLANQLAGTPHGAMLVIRKRAELAIADGETVNAFWFEDSRWKGAAYRGGASVGIAAPVTQPEQAAETAPEGVDTELGERIWNGMNKALKNELGVQSYDTWIRPIKPLGALNGALYLQIPSPDFVHVRDRYEIAKFLPAGVGVIHLLSATGVAA